jgi:hypothetical protein
LSNHLETRPGRVVIDKTTGQELRLRDKHDLFFVPLLAHDLRVPVWDG